MATTKRVNADFLNLRNAPKTGAVISELPRATPVTVTGPSPVVGWVAVKVGTGASTESGFVSEKLLRDPVSDTKEELMLVASTEWMRFDKGTGQEHQSPYFKFVGEMWGALGLDLDGKDRDMPWSAAYISWCVRNAGGYTGFKFSASHSKYIVDGISKKLSGTAAPFGGFEIGDKKPELGDMVCQWRVNKMTYDNAVAAGSFKSHCDIVMEVGDGFVRALGGNNNQTVGYKKYNLTSGGFLTDEKNVFAILKNQK